MYIASYTGASTGELSCEQVVRRL